MTEHPYLAATRASYDAVAESYAELVPPRVAEDHTGRAMLGAFAGLVRAGGGSRTVADVGCGPGHITAHLNALGVPAFGVDLSPKMVEVARRTHPELRFEVGSMTALDLPDRALSGIVAWWSILHTPPDLLPVVFAEFHRALSPGGHLLLGFHAGEGRSRPTTAYGHPVSYDRYLLPPDHVAAQLAAAGLPVTARLLGDGGEGTKYRQACLLASRAVEERAEG